MLARGPWPLESVTAQWREDRYAPPPAVEAAADEAIGALHGRGSPSHDGVSARLVEHRASAEALELVLEPVRWALRLLPGDASLSMAALTVTRAADGRWLAGRRAAWMSSWPGRWALGAGGAVDEGENPADTLVRELEEEWSVAPERITVEALVCLPQRLVMLVGLAWLHEGAKVLANEEHDAHAWWPSKVADWPPEADEPLRRVATMLGADASP